MNQAKNQAKVPTPATELVIEEPVQGATPVNDDNLSVTDRRSVTRSKSYCFHVSNESSGNVEEREGEGLRIIDLPRPEAFLHCRISRKG